MSVLQRVRVISNERLDIPDFRNLSNFNCADWGAFFNKFMADTPHVVTGFDITSPRSLIGTTATEVTINIANSVMFHPASIGVEAAFFVATATADSQTVALSPGSTNFIEMEYSLSTGAPDTRKFWDPSAAGGDGEEFSQIIDTVENLDVTVTVNTIGFTEGRVPIAQVVVNAVAPPAIVSITDSRPMFFRLGTGGSNPDPLNDFIFPDDPTGYARVDSPVTIDASSAATANPFKGSDKGIRHFKDWMDAVMTRIKELGGTAFWFAPASGLISGASLSELWWDSVGSKLTGNGLFVHSGGAAIGDVTFGNINILDGETFTLDDGVNPATVFEFDNDASVGGGNVAVTIGAASVTVLNTIQEFRDAAIAAINGVGGTLDITASIGGDGIVQLINDTPGAVGNVAISETVADVGFTFSGMAGGGDTGLFTWTTDMFVRSIIGNYFFKIAASSVTLDDDEVAYIEQVRNIDLPSAATLTWTNLVDYIDGSAGAFAGLSIGDFIKKESDGIERYVRIVDFKDAANGGGASTTAAAALSVTLEVTLCANAGAGTINIGDTVTDTVDGGTATVVSIEKDVLPDSTDVRVIVDTISGTFNNSNALTFTSGGTATFEQFVGRYEGTSDSEKGQYAKSIYTVSVAKRDDVPNSSDVWWLAMRADNGSSTSKIFLRDGRGLAEGTTAPISGAPSNDTLTYIGAADDSDSTPGYNIDASDAIIGSSNYNSINGENLTVRTSKLTSMVADKAQDKLIRLREGGNISWLVVGPPVNTLSWSSSFVVQIPSSNDNNTIASGSIILTAGQAAYFEIDRNAPSALSLTVVDEDAVPQGENVFVFAHRGTNNRVYLMDGTSLGDGDTVLLGSPSIGANISTKAVRNFICPAIDNLGLTSTGANNPRDVSFSDLRFLHGVERIYVQDIASVFNENGGALSATDGNNPIFKPILRNEQKVWEDRIRLVGQHWGVTSGTVQSVDSGMLSVYNLDRSGSGQNADEYIEITFYGTGCSILTLPQPIGTTVSVDVDGSSTGSIDFSTSTPVGADTNNGFHQYKAVEIPGAKNLTAGLHTVRLTIDSIAATNALVFYGFEVYCSTPTRLPGRAIIDGVSVEFNSVANPTLPSSGLKGLRSRYYLDTLTQTFAFVSTSDMSVVQSGTIDFNGASPDRITGLSDPTQFYNTTNSQGNVVLITDTGSGAQRLAVPTAINAGNLEFANSAFVGETRGISYGDDLTDTNSCTVELWGIGLKNGIDTLQDHDTLFNGNFMSFNDRNSFSLKALDETFLADAHGIMHDNHTGFGVFEGRIETAAGGTSNPILVLDNSPQGSLKLTFLGTGLAITNNGDSDSVDVFVDDIQIGTAITFDDGLNDLDLTQRRPEHAIVTELPFGWHTVQFEVNSGSAGPDIAMVEFRVLGQTEPIVATDDIPIAEIFMLPSSLSDLGTDDSVAETDRPWGWTERGALYHYPASEIYLDGTGWVRSRGVGVNEPLLRYTTDTLNDEAYFVFYGTYVGVRFQGQTASLPTVDLYVDGVLQTSVATVSTNGDKREIRLGSFTEGQHLLRIVYSGGTGTLALEGVTSYGRQTLRPYKPMYRAAINRALHGNSSWLDLRPLTPHENTMLQNWRFSSHGRTRGTSVDTSNQTTNFGQQNMRRGGETLLFYSETGTVQLDIDQVLSRENDGGSTAVDVLFDWWLDTRRLGQWIEGYRNAKMFRVRSENTGAFLGDSTDNHMVGVHVVLNIGKGWHTLCPTLSESADSGDHFSLGGIVFSIKDIE